MCFHVTLFRWARIFYCSQNTKNDTRGERARVVYSICMCVRRRPRSLLTQSHTHRTHTCMSMCRRPAPKSYEYRKYVRGYGIRYIEVDTFIRTYREIEGPYFRLYCHLISQK